MIIALLGFISILSNAMTKKSCCVAKRMLCSSTEERSVGKLQNLKKNRGCVSQVVVCVRTRRILSVWVGASGIPLRVRRLCDELKLRLFFCYRRLDGTSYNKDQVFWGAAMEDVTRDVPAMYPDGIALPSGTCTPDEKQTGKCRYAEEVNGFGSHRPPPRSVSNNLFQQVRKVVSTVDGYK